MKEKVMKRMKMNKALLPLLLCCFIFPASGKDGKRQRSTVLTLIYW
ncbi:hypothetical protein AB80_5629 [Escherichia coli 6-319-05_S1_C3]|nr:hypothetical protein AB80_5629 [Escherichia coli 6-319-05_S1_C3]